MKAKKNSLSSLIEELTDKENFRPKLKSLKKKINLNLPNKTRVITIGGTNGKGECVFRLEQMFIQNKKKVASFSSPHIKCITERFRYQGNNITREEFLNLVENNSLKANGLSFYEFVFLLFIRWIENLDLDYLILEVGLGGRWDAVNLIDSDLAIITSISRDHTAILGNSYRKILEEKVEITRRGKPLLTSLSLSYLKRILKNYCETKQVIWSNYYSINRNFSENNTYLAYKAFSLLEGENQAILEFTSKLLRGYDCEVFKDGVRAYLSGAHNIDGMRQTIRRLKEKKVDKVIISFSRRDKKELMHMVKMLGSLVELDNIFLSSFEHFKALCVQEIESLAKDSGVKYIGKSEELVLENNTLYIGSIYFLGQLYSSFDLDLPNPEMPGAIESF